MAIAIRHKYHADHYCCHVQSDLHCLGCDLCDASYFTAAIDESTRNLASFFSFCRFLINLIIKKKLIDNTLTIKSFSNQPLKIVLSCQIAF